MKPANPAESVYSHASFHRAIRTGREIGVRAVKGPQVAPWVMTIPEKPSTTENSAAANAAISDSIGGGWCALHAMAAKAKM